MFHVKQFVFIWISRKSIWIPPALKVTRFTGVWNSRIRVRNPDSAHLQSLVSHLAFVDNQVLLFTDAKSLENLIQQILRSDCTDDFSQFVGSFFKIDDDNFYRKIVV